MRHFDLRGLLPQPAQPAAEAIPTFEPLSPNEAPPTPLPTPLHPSSFIPHPSLSHHRHTCPDLLAQLRTAQTSPIDTVICTCLDGDATLRLNTALASRYPDDLLAGLAFLDALLSPRHSWLVTDDTAPADWLAPVRAAARLARRRLVPLRNDYPESDPSLLLYTLLRRRLKPGRLPTDVRVLLLDAPAAIALGQYARTGSPPTHTFAALHHPDWPAARYFHLPLNTPLSALLAHTNLRPEDHVLRAGDLLRDHKVTPDTPVATGELTFHANHLERDAIPDPCVRCGWCYEGCPVRIHPAGLLEAAQRDDLALARHYGLDACIECGICSYVCPSRLPLLPGIRRLRKELAR